MIRAFFREVGWPFSGLAVAVATIVPGLLLLTSADPQVEIAWGLIAFGSVIGIVSLIGFYFAVTDFLDKRRNSLSILDGWYCYYFPTEKRFNVSIPMDIVSAADTVRMECVAEFGEQVEPLQMIGRLSESPFVRHRYVPEFQAASVELPESLTIATVKFKIRLSDGVSKKKTKHISVQVSLSHKPLPPG